MTGKTRILTVIALLGSGVIASTGVTTGHENQDGPLACEIAVKHQGNRVVIQPTVHADESMRGEFSFRVKGSGSSGNTNIRQANNFHVEAGDSIAVGKIMLNGNKSYTATLELEADGNSAQCQEEIHASL